MERYVGNLLRVEHVILTKQCVLVLASFVCLPENVKVR